MKRIVLILVLLLSVVVNAQDVKKMLVGKWVYVKTIDKSNKQLEGNSSSAQMGKQIVIGQDNTFKNDFEDGNWQLLSDDEIEFECIVPENSKRGRAIVLDQKMGGKKRRTDGRGNFLDTSLSRIVSITPKEIKLLYDDEQYQVYKKVN